MIPLPLAWTLLTISLWTLGSSQIPQQGTANSLYPKILSTVTIECDCRAITCDAVYWFRISSNLSEIKFLGSCNNAERTDYGADVDKARFAFSKKGSMSFMLRITNVTEEDTAFYSCALKNMETWKLLVHLQPGVNPPVLPPQIKPKPPVKTACDCSRKASKGSKGGCSSLVLWPLVALTATLALAIICTLYYFSRLPKKCRHQFVKK